MARPGFEADRFQVMLMDVASGKKRKLAESWDRSAGDLRWSAGRQDAGGRRRRTSASTACSRSTSPAARSRR